MRSLLFVLLLGLSTFVAASEQNYIEVRGEAISLHTPDYVQITLGVDSQATKPAQAAKNNAKAMAKLVDFLTSQGIKENDLSSEQLSLNAQIDYRKNRVTGYNATRTLQVWVRDFANFDQLLVDLAELGGNRMSNLRFGLDSTHEWQAELQAQAIVNAVQKANVLADAAEVSLGVPIYISEIANNTRPQPLSRSRLMSDSAENIQPSLQAKKITLTYAVLVRFALH